MKAKALIVVMAILLGSVFALAAANTGTIVVRDKVLLNGKQLPVGEYKVKWEGNGPAVDITILQGKKPVATGKATVKELQTASAYDTVIYKGEKDNKTIAEVQFAGKKTSLVFE